jgi:hypothetical protein
MVIGNQKINYDKNGFGFRILLKIEGSHPNQSLLRFRYGGDLQIKDFIPLPPRRRLCRDNTTVLLVYV